MLDYKTGGLLAIVTASNIVFCIRTRSDCITMNQSVDDERTKNYRKATKACKVQQDRILEKAEVGCYQRA